MRMETIPFVLGGLIGLIGLGLLLDAWMPDDTRHGEERRRHRRVERDRFGEGLVGLGVLAMAAAERT